MSHEIRTPMNGIIGLLDLALKTELNEVFDEIDYLIKHFNDAVDYERIEKTIFLYSTVECYKLITLLSTE